jgi:hypothetical protein
MDVHVFGTRPVVLQFGGHDIDTLEYVKKLEAAGLDRKLAEAHAEALRATVVQDLATKSDLQIEVQRLEAKIQLMTWMIGFNLAATMAILWELLR